MPRRAHRRRTRKACRTLLFSLLLATGCGNEVTLDGEGEAQRCASCHLAEYQSVTHPPHAGARPTTCGVCHLDTSWHPYRLDHAWPLEGAHAKAACFDCHRGQPRQFKGTSQACLACHGADHDAANLRVSHHAQFPTTCETCHSTVAWKPTLPHEASTGVSGVDAPLPRADSAGTEASASATPRRLPAPTAAPKKTPTARPQPSTAPTRAPRRTPDSVTGASPVWNK